MNSNSNSSVREGSPPRRSRRQRGLQPDESIDSEDELHNENMNVVPPPAKQPRRERPITEYNSIKQKEAHELREEEGLNVEAKYGGVSRAGSKKQDDRSKTQVRISIEPAITMLGWIDICDNPALPRLKFWPLVSRAKSNIVFHFMQLIRQLSFNACIGNGSQQTHQFDILNGVLAGFTKNGLKFSINHVSWILSDMLDSTYRPQSIEDLLTHMDHAIASGSSNGLMLASRLSLLGLNFSWATIFNEPNLEIVKTNAFIKLSLLPIKYAYQAMHGHIDILSWRKVMAEFGIESVVHKTFVGGPAMPPNDELRRVLQQNPNLRGDRAANDTEVLSIFYGTKLSFKQVLLNVQQLIHFEDNFEAVLHARHNILRSEAEVNHALNLGFYDYTIEVLQHRNKLYYEHRAQERNREAVIGSFLADLLVKNGATLPFDHTVMKLQTPEDFQPPLLFKPFGYEEMFWTVAADHLDLEALDVTITHTFERPSDILRYLGVKVPDIPQAVVGGSPGNYGAEEEEEELIPYENLADDIADPVDFDNDAFNGDREQTPRGTPDGSVGDATND